MATDLDLTAAIEAAAKVLAYEAEEDSLGEALPWDAATEDYKTIFRLSAREVLTAAVPLIEEQVRMRASDELRAWAEEIKDPGITGPRAIRRRTLMSAASKILPKLTAAELAQKIATGEAYVIHCTALDIHAESAVRPPAAERWTQEELDAAKREAQARAERLRPLLDDGGEALSRRPPAAEGSDTGGGDQR